MKIFRFFVSRVFWINLLVFGIVLLSIFIGIRYFLSSYTQHGESLTVPELKGFTTRQVEDICSERNLKYKIVDSIYMPGIPYFTVVEQSPKALSKVKQNRTLYLKISSDRPPKAKLPNLTDVSLRQAINILQSAGFKVGELEYVPDIAQNQVLKVKKDGRVLNPGVYLKKGSALDLVLGDGLSSKKVRIPDLRGLSYDEAMFALTGFGFNIGAVIFDPAVSDSAQAIIHKQFPLPDPEIKIAQGESIDLWLTTADKFKAMNMNINKTLQDSLKDAQNQSDEDMF